MPSVILPSVKTQSVILLTVTQQLVLSVILLSDIILYINHESIILLKVVAPTNYWPRWGNLSVFPHLNSPILMISSKFKFSS